MKYIIKNCPCFVEGIAIKGNEQKTQTCNNHKVRELTLCKDCTDCKLKQIVERCRKEQKYHKEWQKETGFNYAATGLRLAEEILKLLDIEECE